MHEIKQRLTVSDTGEIVVTLPPDFPRGEVEVTVVAAKEASANAVVNLNRRLDELIASLPPAPSVPVSALDRGEIYRWRRSRTASERS